jgi:hypothetical protein
VWSSLWNNWQGKSKNLQKTCPSAALSTTNATRSYLGSNPSRRGGKPAANRLNCGTALLFSSLKTAEIIHNHQNENVRNIGQGETPHREYKKLNIGGGHLYDCSSV